MAQHAASDRNTADPRAGDGRAEYIAVSSPLGQIDGVLRRSPAGSDTVVLQTHPRRDSVGNIGAWPMADLPLHGVDTFAFNNRYSNSAAGIDMATIWELLALDVAVAVTAMRDRGYRHVVLYGTSAGGPLMAYYQNVAENGNAVFEGSGALSAFTGYLAADGTALRLPVGDALVFQNVTAGPATSFLYRLDASVVDETLGVRDPGLDLFSPKNGFDPDTGTAEYSRSFLADYQVAQALRMNRLVRVAQERLAAIRALRIPFSDDGFMVIPGTRGFPAHVDLSLAHRSEQAWPMAGTAARAPVVSTRSAVARAAELNLERAQGGAVHSLLSFLSYRAILSDPTTYDPYSTKASGTGVDDASSNTSTVRNLRGASVPLLVTVGTADVEVHLPTGELIAQEAPMSDKQLVAVADADHSMRGVLGTGFEARAAHLGVVATWLQERFLT